MRDVALKALVVAAWLLITLGCLAWALIHGGHS